MEHVEELLEHRARVRDVDAEPFELVGLIARADPEHEPSAAETVDHADLREHPGRLVERRDDYGGRQRLIRARSPGAQWAAMMSGEGQMQ